MDTAENRSPGTAVGVRTGGTRARAELRTRHGAGMVGPTGSPETDIAKRVKLNNNDSTRIAYLLAGTTFAIGLGVLVLQAVGGYGPAPDSYQDRGAFVYSWYLGMWVAHSGAYLLHGRLPHKHLTNLAYLAAQLALVVGISIASGRAIGVFLLFVVWGAQAVVLYPCRWPVTTITGGTAAIFAMSPDPMETRQVIVLATIITMTVMTTYLVSHVRATIARRDAKQLLDELSATKSEMNGYASEVEEAALTSERHRMARELHDTLAQGLVGVTLQLEAAESHLERGSTARAREIVEETMKRARETLADARRAIQDLREDREEDLESVLRREASRFSGATGMKCEIVLTMERSLSPQTAEVVRRTVTEALTNAARHSRAQNVSIAVSSLDDRVRVQIADDGVGFEKETVATNGHYGLLGLSERARTIGGTIVLETIPGSGTTVTLMCPNESAVPVRDA